MKPMLGARRTPLPFFLPPSSVGHFLLRSLEMILLPGDALGILESVKI